MISVVGYSKGTKQLIPDNSNIVLICPDGFAEIAKEALENKHGWHIVNRNSENLYYVVKINITKWSLTRFTAVADIYEGNEIIGSTKSVKGHYSSKKKIIKKLIKKRF